MTDAPRACNCSGGCGSSTRRDFLKLVSLGGAALAAGVPAMAGAFEASDFARLIPADKKLTAEWIASLFARGTRTVYRGDELRTIGMPIGGICAGQVYLGGDGRLWHWDIFNEHIDTGAGGPHYAEPMKPAFPFKQGFAIRTRSESKSTVRTLDQRGFADITFTGEYPIGYVNYRDAESPVSVTLEAFSPFIPLNPEDSHLPATVLQFNVKNESKTKVEGELAGWLQNAVCLHSAERNPGTRTNAIVRGPKATLIHGTASPSSVASEPPRPVIVFADFEGETFAPWTVEGDAFGTAPVRTFPPEETLIGMQGHGLVDSYVHRDPPTGKMTSPEFTIERTFISFMISGGAYPGRTCMNMVIDGQVVRTATGKNSSTMAWVDWGVRQFAGKRAHLEIVDAVSGGWGHVNIDQIEFRDTPRGDVAQLPLKDSPDFGTMGLALLEPQPHDFATASLPDGELPQAVFAAIGQAAEPEASQDFTQPLVGALGRPFALEPGQTATITFVVAWHFPQVLHFPALKDIQGRHYGKRFATAQAVAEYVAANFAELAQKTRLWHDTWYDSTLPYWFLDRTFLNISILATSTAYWFGNNRFYGWEGVGCCEGTCQHVWQYAQAVARIFPSLERTTREMVDYGLAFHDNGATDYRGEFAPVVAIDGQPGTILRVYREHQMSADGAFLTRIWPKVKKSLEYMIALDPNQDGILEGSAMNTLDMPWYGKVAWLSSLYVASLRAGEQMALEMGDVDFARHARTIVDAGSRNIDQQLFNGEYYYQLADPAHTKEIGSYNGCESDQVMGQGFAFQVGLDRVLPREHTVTALRSIWKYNFTPDVAAFRKVNQAGRWYAMPGEGGLILCSWPQGDQQRTPGGTDGYFNECMTGFEYQAASHMVWEGLVEEGLAVTRAIHDRYHAARRNPWNEIECGDHYARAMASYGVYLAACGFQYHGPKGQLGFAPRLTPEDFRAAFTAAEGWGTFRQRRTPGEQTAQVQLRWGTLRLTSLALELADGVYAARVTVRHAGRPLAARLTGAGSRVRVELAQSIVLDPSGPLEVTLSLA